MKYLIVLLVVLMASCDPVKFEVRSGSSFVTNAVVIGNGIILNQGELPFDVSIEKREVIQASFEAHATNFTINHQECDCEKVNQSLYRCTQTKEVDGEDWVIAE